MRLGGYRTSDNVSDQGQFEWMLAYGVYLLQHGTDPFFTDLLNAPRGVNLAMNTSSTFESGTGVKLIFMRSAWIARSRVTGVSAVSGSSNG